MATSVPRIMLTGVPGVGKTTVATHPQVDTGLMHVANFGIVMLNLGIQKRMVRDIDELNKLDIERRSKLQKWAADSIRRYSCLPVLIDGHMSVDTPAGFVPGLPEKCVNNLKLTAIVVLTAEPSEIISRRMKGRNKYAFLDNSEERIKLHQELLLQACVHYATTSSSYIQPIQNSQDRVEETVDSLRSYLASAGFVPGFALGVV